MKNLAIYLLALVSIYSTPLKASDIQDPIQLTPEQSLYEYGQTKNLMHLKAFNEILAEPGDRLRNQIKEDIVARATDAMFQQLETEITMDHISGYLDRKPLIKATIYFCARMQPKLKAEQIDKLIAACELCRTIEINKISGMGFQSFDEQIIELTSSIDSIILYYKKRIPTKLLTEYGEFDPLSRFAVKLGYFISLQAQFYRKKPRLTIAVYLGTIAALFALKKYLVRQR